MDWGSCTAVQPSISPLDSSFAREREGHGGITFGLNHGEVDERRQAKEKRHNLRGWLHALVCPCPCVRVCLCSSARACVCVGAWVDGGLCVPMTVKERMCVGARVDGGLRVPSTIS